MPRDLPPPLEERDLEELIDRAVAEDLGSGDITCEAVLPPGSRFSGVMAARQSMIVAGLPAAAAIFKRFDSNCAVDCRRPDGDRVNAGDVILSLKGSAAALLSGERIALNLIQHLSGIATHTARFANAIAHTEAELLDTRKTIPGLRKLAKYATRLGGARNHRMGLHDGILIKDNHIAVCGGVAEAVKRAKAKRFSGIEVECDTLAQVREATDAGADIVLLDNMTNDQLREAVVLVAGRAKTEASGGVKLDTIAAIAETGVDFISVGAITQSAPAVDIGLDWTAINDE